MFIVKLYQKLKLRWVSHGYPYKPFMHQHRCIFVHIPKNAGSSVLSLFNDTGARWHVSWLHYYRANSYWFKQYYKFTIVREPLSRLYSAYCYAVNGGNKQANDLHLQKRVQSHCQDFNDFVLTLLDSDMLLSQELFVPQYSYVFDRQQTCKVNQILRYESLAQDWRLLAERLKVSKDLPHVNVNQSQTKLNIAALLSDAALAKVEQLYRLDYQLFNYPLPSVVQHSQQGVQ